MIEINDIRDSKEFKSTTFSEFKKTDAKKELLSSLYNSKIEPACYWSAEFICAGHYSDLWDIIILFFSKNIHIGNPKLITYIDLRISNFKEIQRNGYSAEGMAIRMRNNEKIRKLFAEVICVLCEAKKRHDLTDVKVPHSEFDLTVMTDRLKASSAYFAQDFFLKDDPKEFFIASNELAYSISTEGKNNMDACYWTEWINEYAAVCKQKKDKKNSKCDRRTFAEVESKSQMDVVWLVWDSFLNESKKRNLLVQRLVKTALRVFCFRYTQCCYRKRKFLLYFVIELFTEPFSTEEEIVRDKTIVVNVINNIHTIYKQIKLNEHSPGTDYLYQNVNASNLEKTIAILETMNSLGEEYTPRTSSTNK